MPLTNEELKIIVPELHAAYLHLSRASELLAFFYHDLRRGEKGPAMTMVSKLVAEIEKMRRGLQWDVDESILSRLIERNIFESSDIDASHRRCREMFMRHSTERPPKASAQIKATSAPKKKRKSLVKPKRVLRFEGGKSHPPRDKKT